MADLKEDGLEDLRKDGTDNVLENADSTAMNDVSDWVRRSVLFWNEPDSASIDGGSDIQEHELNRSDSTTGNQEKALKISIESASEEVGPEPSRWEIAHESTAEPAKFFNVDKEASTGDMILDVEKIQKLLIEPFIMEKGVDNKTGSCDSLYNDSPYYTLNFPKYTEHIYSPLYEEHLGLRKENHNPAFAKRGDWNIADTLNSLNQCWGQIESSSYNSEKCQKEAGQCANEHGTDIKEMERKRKNLDSDVLSAIKRVQETLGEIADELETTRTRTSSKDDKDPNLILVNLLSRIPPPVNRDSFACSPTNDAPEASQEEKTAAQNIIQGSNLLSAIRTDPMAEDLSKTAGNEEEFDVFNELSDPEKTTEEVLQEFMDKISTMSKPSSALRGFLKRISEEVTTDNSLDLNQNRLSDLKESQNEIKSRNESETSERAIRNEKESRNEGGKEIDSQGSDKKGDNVRIVNCSEACKIMVEHESNTECDNQHGEGQHKPQYTCNDQVERRISSVSGNSSLPTSPSATNYDSGFSELTKNLRYTRKESLTSFIPDESTKANMERRLREAFEKSKTGFDSETSTDWSPCSTLSNNDTAFKQKSALKQSPFQRVSPRRRSTGTANSKPSFRLQTGNTNSCPNFDRNGARPVSDSLNRYTRAEVEAIRKFLSLTSLYFGSKVATKDVPSATYDELIQRGDIEVIHNVLQRQRDDLERQRRKQDDLYGHLGDLLLQLVTLKEEHLSSTQKQTKALTLLKKQLDMQKKEQTRAQEAIKDQVKTLGEQFSSSMSLSKQGSDSLKIQTNLAAQMQIPRSPTSKHGGQIIWKITGITRKVTRIHAGASDNVSVSEPFYSGLYGYKMAAWVYLNGRADFKGKGISVYVCPLCGEYDAILPWPIKPVYTFTLIDQNPDPSTRHNHTKVRNVVEISKKCDTALSSKGGIPRPLQGSKSFIIGFDDFISQSELASGKYILDDTMFLKVEADISN